MSIKESERIPTVSNDAELSDQELAIVVGGGEGTLFKIEGTKGKSADDKHRDAVHIGGLVQEP